MVRYGGFQGGAVGGSVYYPPVTGHSAPTTLGGFLGALGAGLV